MLDMLFSRFDAPAEGWGLEKSKTIGDAYMTARSFQSKLYAPGADRKRSGDVPVALRAPGRETRTPSPPLTSHLSCPGLRCWSGALAGAYRPHAIRLSPTAGVAATPGTPIQRGRAYSSDVSARRVMAASWVSRWPPSGVIAARKARVARKESSHHALAWGSRS